MSIIEDLLEDVGVDPDDVVDEANDRAAIQDTVKSEHKIGTTDGDGSGGGSESSGGSSGGSGSDNGNNGGYSGGSIGCYITTALAEDQAALNSLRQFRDDSMARTPLGRALIDIYYIIGPPIATTLQRHPDSTYARIIRWLIMNCASLSNRQDQMDSSVWSVGIAVFLTGIYTVGVLIGIVGHIDLRLREIIKNDILNIT